MTKLTIFNIEIPKKQSLSAPCLNLKHALISRLGFYIKVEGQYKRYIIKSMVICAR